MWHWSEVQNIDGLCCTLQKRDSSSLGNIDQPNEGRLQPKRPRMLSSRKSASQIASRRKAPGVNTRAASALDKAGWNGVRSLSSESQNCPPGTVTAPHVADMNREPATANVPPVRVSFHVGILC